MLKKLTIKKRLAITIGILLSLFVLTVFVTVTVDRRTSNLVERLHNEEFRLVVVTRTINGSIEGICRAFLYAIVTKDAKVARESVQEADRLAAVVRNALEELRTLPLGEKAALLDAVNTHFSLLPPARAAIREQLLNGDFDLARAIYISSYFPSATDTRTAVMELFSQAEKDAQYLIDVSAIYSRNLITIILGIAAIMGLVALFMSRQIIRSISLPIQELEAASAAIAEGDLCARIGYDSDDELGSLADSMRKGVNSLAKYIKEIERVLSSLGKGNFDCEIQPVFKGDFIVIENALRSVAALLEQQKRKDEQSMESLREAYAAAEHANKAKSDFLSHMSHDIRTPMNAIIGMSAIAAADVNNTVKVEHCLNKIMLSSRHLLGLINDVLDMAKIESGNMSLHVDNLSLPELVENVTTIIQPQIKAKKQSFNIRLHRIRHEWLKGDALRMNQIFINLLSNAVKFTPMRGEITIDVEETDSAKQGYARFLFRVSDTGIGMSPGFLDTIFSAFSRDIQVEGSVEGSGLGMAIVKKFVDMMEGTISIVSTVGQGTTFTIDLHLKLADTEPEYSELPPLKVLVVDDDTISGKTVMLSLRDMGIASEWVDNGSSAIASVLDAQKRGESYSAVILDYMMPEMDGLETARRIRDQVENHIPILIVSAYDWSDFENEAKASGIDGFVPKPLFKSTLYRALVKHISGMASLAADEGLDASCDFSGKRILLVEDNEINREVAIEILSFSNAAVEIAENGIEAVARFSEAREDYYDLILMDVQMPLMDGYEATRQIRGLYRKDARTVPIIAMTANAFSEDIIMSIESGMNSHISKPLDVKILRRKLLEVFKSPDRTGATDAQAGILPAARIAGYL